jgi:hypothetical protein
MSQPQLHFLEMLKFPYFFKLMNDMVCHNPNWPPILTKIPLEIPKLEGKEVEDLGDHVMKLRLWFFFKSPMDDYTRPILFQCTFTMVFAKWYIKLHGSSFHNFHVLAIVFLNHFQLPIWYDAINDIFYNLRKDNDTYISDHIK